VFVIPAPDRESNQLLKIHHKDTKDTKKIYFCLRQIYLSFTQSKFTKMKNLIFSFVLFFFAVNTTLVYTYRFDDDYISLYDDKIPDGFYLKKADTNPISPVTKIRFGIPDTSIISIKTYDIEGRIVESDSTKLGGGNYIYDWGHYLRKENFKSGIYFIVLNAEFVRINKSNVNMKFTGRTKIIVVK
jgi:hypothetical protein